MAVDDAEVGRWGLAKKKKKKLFQCRKSWQSVYLGGNMMPHLQDGYPYPCPFFCWNAEARENLNLNLDKEQCGALRAQLLERGREGACGMWFQKVGEYRKALEILQGLRKTLWSESWGT